MTAPIGTKVLTRLGVDPAGAPVRDVPSPTLHVGPSCLSTWAAEDVAA